MGGQSSKDALGASGSQYRSSGNGSVGVGETGRRQRSLQRCGNDPRVHHLLEEEFASRAMILSEYELEADRISNRHPLSPQSIATYTTESNLVFIRHGKAYDATNWFEIHPGGKFVLLKYAGKDVTEIFDRFHSRTAKKNVESEVIGPVWMGRGKEKTSRVLMQGLKSPPTPIMTSSSTSGGYPQHGGAHNSAHSSVGSQHHHHNNHTSPYTSPVRLPFGLASPTGSDHGDYEGRIVRIKPLTPSGNVVRIFVAFPERLRCELGGSIVIKHKGVPRNYSPCYIEETNFSLVVKRYEKGIVSSYLFSKKIGDCLEFDGPYAPKCVVPDRRFRTLLLIGQGTGVIPILEVARTVMAETIYFVSCYSCVDDVLFSKELSMMPENVRLVYFIPSADLEKDANRVPGLLFNCRFSVEKLVMAMAVTNGDFASRNVRITPAGSSRATSAGTTPKGAGGPMNGGDVDPYQQQQQRAGSSVAGTMGTPYISSSVMTIPAPQVEGLRQISAAEDEISSNSKVSADVAAALLAGQLKGEVTAASGAGFTVNTNSSTSGSKPADHPRNSPDHSIQTHGLSNNTTEVTNTPTMLAGSGPSQEAISGAVTPKRQQTGEPIPNAPSNTAAISPASTKASSSTNTTIATTTGSSAARFPFYDIHYTMVCGSFTFFDDVQRAVVEELGVRKSSVMQL